MLVLPGPTKSSQSDAAAPPPARDAILISVKRPSSVMPKIVVAQNWATSMNPRTGPTQNEFKMAGSCRGGVCLS